MEQNKKWVSKKWVYKNKKWVSNISTKASEIELQEISYYDGEEKKIQIILGSCSESRYCKKINKILFYEEDANKLGELGEILEDELEKLEYRILPYSLKYWKQRFLGRFKNITRICDKVQAQEELSKNDLRILYGLDCVFEATRSYKVGYFGYDLDPRIVEIFKTRNRQTDFLNFTEEEQKDLLSNSPYSDCEFKNATIENKNAIIGAEALKFAPDHLLKDPKFIREYIKKTSITSEVLKYTKENINGNKKIVLLVLQTKSNNDFMYVSEKLKNDKEVVMEAVKRNGLMYQYVGDALKDDKVVIMTAILQNKEAAKLVNPEYIEKYSDIKLVCNIIRIMESYNKLSSENKKQVQDDLTLLISLAPKELRESPDIMKNAYVINKDTYNLASEEVQRVLKRKFKRNS